jgi:DNA-binding GntR family transcriptional regulator
MTTRITKPNEKIYSRIISDVVCGNIRPGERLGEESLAARWKIGRSAVREAMFRLEQDGLVVRKAKVGTFLREINDKEFLEIYDLRIAIECLVISRAAEVITDRELEELGGLAQRVDSMPDENENRVGMDQTFHNRLSEISKLSYAPRMLALARLHAQCSLLNQRLIFLRGYLKQEIPKPDHRDIVEVLRLRSPDKAGKVMREHLEAAKKFVLRDIDLIQTKMSTLERE